MPFDPTRRKCFVISSYGKEEGGADSSDRRVWERALAVMDRIVAGAVDEVDRKLRSRGESGLAFYRGDHVGRSGQVTRSIFRSICRDHILVAVLLCKNENVAFEIGLAEAMGRPVILLKHSDYEVPFDLIGRRYIEFDDRALDGDSTRRAAVVERLGSAMLEHLPKSGAPDFTTNPLHEHAVPFGRCIPFDRFRVSYEEWSRVLRQAESEIWIAGTSLLQLFELNHFFWPKIGEDGEPLLRDGVELMENVNLSDVLAVQYLNGCSINLMIMDEANPALRCLLTRPDGAALAEARDVTRVAGEIRATTMRVRTLIASLRTLGEKLAVSRRPGTFRFTKIRSGLLMNRVTMTEKRAYVTPNFYTLRVNTGPCFEIAPKSASETMDTENDSYSRISFYNVVREDLQLLQNVNPSLTMRPDLEVEDGLRPSSPRTRRSK